MQQHWRATSESKRVFLLTRSAFLGQQRVGATVWSGDIYSSFRSMRRQVSAGLNFALSGQPYWTTEVGGYHLAYDGELQVPAYQELYLRWFEFGVFCPVFRTHGHRLDYVLWAYPNIWASLADRHDKLRCRMMPYMLTTGGGRSPAPTPPFSVHW